MFNVAIVGDRVSLKPLVEKIVRHPWSSSFKIVQLDGPTEFEGFIDAGNKVDILFMGIFFGDDAPDGIDVVAKLLPAGAETQVIYITRHIEYCTKVYRTEHVHFLVAPVDESELHDALNLALSNLDEQRRHPIEVRTERATFLLDPSKVVYIESELRKIRFITVRESLEEYGKLCEVVDHLPRSFVRPHKSFAVNMEHVRAINENSLVLDTGKTIPISRNRSKDIRALFVAFLKDA